MSKNFICYLAMFLILAACSKDTDQPMPMEYNYAYFPLEVGKYRTYEITERHQLGPDSSTATTNTYQLRERIDSTFTDLEGQIFYRVIQGRRAPGETLWNEDSVLILKRTITRLERQISNKRIVQLVFPVTVGRTWNPNLYNADPAKEWKYESVAESFHLQSSALDTTFAETALVVHENDSNLYSERIQKERYAKGVGLIESTTRKIDFNNTNPVYTDQATFITVRLIDFGSL